jgi:hypothetical protein
MAHCHKSWRNFSSPSDISELFHEHGIKNISTHSTNRNKKYQWVDNAKKQILVGQSG